MNGLIGVPINLVANKKMGVQRCETLFKESRFHMFAQIKCWIHMWLFTNYCKIKRIIVESKGGSGFSYGVQLTTFSVYHRWRKIIASKVNIVKPLFWKFECIDWKMKHGLRYLRYRHHRHRLQRNEAYYAAFYWKNSCYQGCPPLSHCQWEIRNLTNWDFLRKMELVLVRIRGCDLFYQFLVLTLSIT